MAMQPLRLGKDPIIEAIAEVRFTALSGRSASKLLPGLVFTQFKDRYKEIIELPASQIPASMRDLDANLRYVPLSHLRGETSNVLIGDRVLAIGSGNKYPGWNAFKKIILEILELSFQNELISNVERVSVKYVNILECPKEGAHLELINAELSVAGKAIEQELFHIRVDRRSGRRVGIIQISSHADVTSTVDASTKHGLILDLDSVVEGPFSDFPNEMSALFDEAHDYEKSIFYDLVTEETLAKYDPQYE